MKLKNEFLKND